ncbi:MAG TPA: tRNA lysidine(34) synthetase TilS [Desulfitobacteriaceae bacterium]|nr:tRNA lysidine(34) synthetase TilS [Desulfitobacteriaceae bacterium]
MYQRLCTQVFPELIADNIKILAAVSGGPDSVALGHLLWRYAQEEKSKGLSLVFSHIHHGIRKESDEEAVLVQKLADELGVPCIIHRFDAKEYAKLSGQSFQLAAREWRYARWQEDCQREGCSLLATAHHLGDQAETILYRLLRGSGTAGLAGIHPSKNGIIRPLLGITKEEILDYCRQEGLSFALDSSNEEPLYDRNRIRLELIPELIKNYNPRILEALGRTGKLLRWDEDFLGVKAQEAWEKYCLLNNSEEVVLDSAVFQEPPAILSRLLRRAATIVTTQPRLSFGFVDKIMNSKGFAGWTQDIPGFRVEIQRREIIFKKNKSKAANFPGQDLSFNIPLRLGEWVRVSDLGISVGLFIFRTDGEQFIKQDGAAHFTFFNKEELDGFRQSLVCRSRKKGDKMWFKGVGHKVLKKVFQEAHIPAGERKRLPLIAGADEILWVPGVKRSDRFLPRGEGLRLYCTVKKG